VITEHNIDVSGVLLFFGTLRFARYQITLEYHIIHCISIGQSSQDEECGLEFVDIGL